MSGSSGACGFGSSNGKGCKHCVCQYFQIHGQSDDSSYDDCSNVDASCCSQTSSQDFSPSSYESVSESSIDSYSDESCSSSEAEPSLLLRGHIQPPEGGDNPYFALVPMSLIDGFSNFQEMERDDITAYDSDRFASESSDCSDDTGSDTSSCSEDTEMGRDFKKLYRNVENPQNAFDHGELVEAYRRESNYNPD